MKDDTHKTYRRLQNDLERMAPDSQLDYSDEDLMMNPEQAEVEKSSETR